MQTGLKGREINYSETWIQTNLASLNLFSFLKPISRQNEQY